jgi:hypothetical protein
MKRKHKPVSQAELLARMPRAFRPKLDRGQLLDLGLAHIVNLDSIARGEAGEETLWDWVGGTLTWSKVAEALGIEVDAMNEQLQLATRLVERYGRTGRVIFTGEDYQLAKVGVMVMDRLAEKVDRPTAVMAADWSEAKINELSAACAQQRAAAADERRAA